VKPIHCIFKSRQTSGILGRLRVPVARSPVTIVYCLEIAVAITKGSAKLFPVRPSTNHGWLAITALAWVWTVLSRGRHTVSRALAHWYRVSPSLRSISWSTSSEEKSLSFAMRLSTLFQREGNNSCGYHRTHASMKALVSTQYIIHLPRSEHCGHPIDTPLPEGASSGPRAVPQVRCL